MTNYDNVLGSLARGGPGAIRYDGDSLTNDEEHQYRIDVAEMFEREFELLELPSDIGSGAFIAALEEEVNELRAMALKIADGFRTMGEAAKEAAPVIRNGTAADPEVQEALRRSLKAYESVEDIVPPEPDITGSRTGPVVGGPAERSPARDDGVGDDVRPRTEVSSDRGPQPPGPMAGGPLQGVPAQQAPMPGPVGGPATMAGAFPPGVGGDGRAFGGTQRPNRRDTETGPDTYDSGSHWGDGGGVVAPMPLVNPSVTGGRVDPSQISGRTASTSPAAGSPPFKSGPAGSIGEMGGLGSMPLGGGGMGNAGGEGRPNMPQPKRDRASERILTGQEARDKALISRILRDDDPPAGEYIDSAELADLLPDERHPSMPPYAGLKPPTPTDAPPPAPVVMNVPPPEPRFIEPVKYPEPRDDEKW